MAASTKLSKRKKRYYEGTGRRKSAVARVKIAPRKKAVQSDASPSYDIIINERPFDRYFSTDTLHKIIEEPFRKIKFPNFFDISVKVKGGGVRGQAEAVRLGIARALRVYKPEIVGELHANKLLTRDPRMKERKKPGKRGARRGQQWSKR